MVWKNTELKQLLKPYLKLHKGNVNWKPTERPEKFNAFNIRQKTSADFIWKCTLGINGTERGPLLLLQY